MSHVGTNSPGGLRIRSRLLVVGCGDVGLRLLGQLAPRITAGRLAVIAVTRNPAHRAAARAHGAHTLAIDLDARRALDRLAGLSSKTIYLAPPPATGTGDPRVGRLIAACSQVLRVAGRPARWVLISTSGVYGDCKGSRIDETHPVSPSTARARRRLAAEGCVRRSVREGLVRAAILGGPGIYAPDRWPVARLRRGIPTLSPEEDVYTNHVHADDLAAIAWLALFRGRPGRVINAVDDSQLTVGDWFDRVADACSLPRPPRLSRDALSAQVSPTMLSFLSESRQLSNRRLKNELRVRLRWPHVDRALAEVAAGRKGTKALL
jgi:nucleoside-diphosphate-sugar epimerase